MNSLVRRVTEFSRSKQGRGLMRQVQERLSGGGRQAGRGGRAERRRRRGR